MQLATGFCAMGQHWSLALERQAAQWRAQAADDEQRFATLRAVCGSLFHLLLCFIDLVQLFLEFQRQEELAAQARQAAEEEWRRQRQVDAQRQEAAVQEVRPSYESSTNAYSTVLGGVQQQRLIEVVRLIAEGNKTFQDALFLANQSHGT